MKRGYGALGDGYNFLVMLATYTFLCIERRDLECVHPGRAFPPVDMHSGKRILVLAWAFLAFWFAPLSASRAAPAEKRTNRTDRSEASSKAKDTQGSVTMPLARLRDLQAEITPKRAEPYENVPVLWVSRRVEGHFRRGLWTGRLVARFEIPEGGPSKVQVIDGRAVVGEVSLDGAPSALFDDDGTFTLPVDRSGRHELTVDFLWGRETQRFTRTLELVFPDGGPIAIEARIGEIGVTPTLLKGALVSSTEQSGETVVSGSLDGSGELSLSWKKKDTGDEAHAEAKIEAQEHTLFHVSDALVTGHSALSIHVTEGETDAIKLALPKGVEVLRVEGDDVLQWHTATAADQSRRLVVLLRHFVTEETALRVDFQIAAEATSLVTLRLPMPEGDVKTTGSLGVVGPPGLRLSVKSAEGAVALSGRDLPQELTSLTKGPVLFGYRLDGAPSLEIASSPLPELSVARTVIDELSASTVLLEDGTERTKLSLRIRNDGRQYVELALPEGARPLSSFIDGREVRPALFSDRLLLPLRQSERLVEDKAREHIVRPGETLSDVANLYYSDPSAWQRIVTKNRDSIPLNGTLVEGTRLVIPPAAEATSEAFFVIEVAYERTSSPLSGVGMANLKLPGLDVDTTKVVWHVYLPSSREPLAFRGNLAQSSRIKYDLFRRLKWYLDAALVPNADAGGEYKSILQKRRAIYDDESTGEGEPFAALTSFPLVGELYRFRRILLGREVAEVRVFYASSQWMAGFRHVALGLVFGVALLALHRGGKKRFMALFAVLVALLVCAHYVPGVHRRIVWGLDFALVFALGARFRPRITRYARVFARAPWLLLRGITWRRLLASGGFLWLLGELLHRPMLLSIGMLGLLSAVWLRLRGAPIVKAKLGARLAVPLAVFVAFVSANARDARAEEEAQQEATNTEEQAAQEGSGEGGASPEGNADSSEGKEKKKEEAPKGDAALFDDLMNMNDLGQEKSEEAPSTSATPSDDGATATMPLSEFDDLARRAEKARLGKAKKPAARVVLGAASYEGEAERDVLSLRMKLVVTLAGEGLKFVPLVGDDVALVSASAEGESLGVMTMPGYHVWVTDRKGVYSIEVQFLVGPRGGRGSIEHAFRASRTPSTRVSIRLPTEGLSPRVSDSVKSDVRAERGGTTVLATLAPTNQIRVIGFRDVGAEDAAERENARAIAETISLLSVDERSVELFTVVRYTILRGAMQSFDVTLPEDVEVISAEGEGAFHHAEERKDGKVIVHGETALPIEESYELSLRLRKRGGASKNELSVLLPHCLGVEREHGWLAVEVPGKLRIEETSRENLVPVTASELPIEARASAVSPILRAYRHHEGAPALGLSVTRLPEQDLEDGAIHSIEATSVLAAEGKLVTELRISLRNASRPSLAVRLPAETELRSAFLDGEPVRPSRDESGLLLLPLARSHGEDHDEPMVLEILLESAVAPQGLFGTAALELPTLDLDAASLKWTMFLPARNDYGDIRARLSEQTYAGSVSWHKPPHIKRAVRWNEDEGKDKRAATSHSPTWSELALSSTEKVHARYWINAGEAVRVEVPFVRSYLLLPLRGLLGLVVLLPIALFVRRRRGLGSFVAAFQSIRMRVPSRVFSWVRRQAWTRRRAGRALSLVLGSAVVLWLFVDRFGRLAKIVAGLIGGDA